MEEQAAVKAEETQSANEDRVPPRDERKRGATEDGDSNEEERVLPTKGSSSPDESSMDSIKASHGDHNRVTESNDLQTMTAGEYNTGDNKATKNTTLPDRKDEEADRPNTGHNEETTGTNNTDDAGEAGEYNMGDNKATKNTTLPDRKDEETDGPNTGHNEEATGTNNTDDAGEGEGSDPESQENTTSPHDEEKKDEQINKIQTIGPNTLETKPGSFNRSDDGSDPNSQENTTSPQDEENKDEQINKIQTIRHSPTTLETKPGSFNRSDDGSGPNSQENTTSRRTALPQDNKEENEQKNINQSPGGNSRFFMQAIVVLVIAVLLYLFFQSESPSQKEDKQQIAIFLRQMEKVKAQFPNQRAEVWDRSKIHLGRHLQTAQPTEPVSLILTAGIGAEHTLHCLAKGLASAFSSALNASVLHIDGASKASQDSDQVKLDIDSKLQGAFEGDKPVAVIHRFEELPPGSTLIFYRYCDHENAAYKKTFLIFTVLLGEEEEIPAKSRLSTVEEMVDDHLQKKFLSDDQPVSFDRMDLDKYGGLWSRISHLILPVTAEKRMEHEGC